MRKMRWRLAAFAAAGAGLFAGCTGGSSENSASYSNPAASSAKAAEEYDISEEAVEGEYDVGTAGFDGDSAYAMNDSAYATDDAEPRADDAGTDTTGTLTSCDTS